MLKHNFPLKELMSTRFRHVTAPKVDRIVLQKTAFYECAGELSLVLDRALNLPLAVYDRQCIRELYFAWKPHFGLLCF